MRADCVTIESGYESRGNPGIWELANGACAATARAQAQGDNGQRFQLLQRALELRQRELEAWTALGDKVGQSLACMGIGNVHFLTNQLDCLQLTNTLEQARTWYARAAAHVEGEAGTGGGRRRGFFGYRSPAQSRNCPDGHEESAVYGRSQTTSESLPPSAQPGSGHTATPRSGMPSGTDRPC